MWKNEINEFTDAFGHSKSKTMLISCTFLKSKLGILGFSKPFFHFFFSLPSNLVELELLYSLEKKFPLDIRKLIGGNAQSFISN